QELDDIVIDGSGTKNFYQSDEPTEGMREGDLWFDVSDQNKPYIYQDGEWVSVRDSYIEDGSVTTEKIAAGAITAESGIIGSINAGTITVGEMEGARIKGHTVTADKLLVGGDRHWIPNGDLSAGDASGWPAPSSGTGPVYSATDKPEGLPGSVAYKTLSTVRGETFGRFPVAGATSLTFSVWVKADKPGSVVYIEVRDQDG